VTHTHRHASFDWADPEELAKRQGSKFCNAKATEVVLGEGQVKTHDEFSSFCFFL
jgi:hypothetical protein